MDARKVKTVQTVLLLDDTELPLRSEERDAQGQVLRREQHGAGDESSQLFIFEYDAAKLLVREQDFLEGELVREASFEYDENGKPVLEKQHYPGGGYVCKKISRDLAQRSETISLEDEHGHEEGRELRRFDAEGRVLEEQIFDEAGKLTSSFRASYDDYGNPLEEQSMDASGFTNYSKYEYQRDEEGRLDSFKVFDEKGKLKRLEVFDYDEKGNRDYHEINNHYEGWGRIYELVFDDEGRTAVSRVFDNDEALLSETSYEYDAEGLVLEEAISSKAGLHKVVHRYTFH
jgi:hypothetical protein